MPCHAMQCAESPYETGAWRSVDAWTERHPVAERAAEEEDAAFNVGMGKVLGSATTRYLGTREVFAERLKSELELNLGGLQLNCELRLLRSTGTGTCCTRRSALPCEFNKQRQAKRTGQREQPNALTTPPKGRTY
jgi:hypothetical protein